MKTLAVLGSTGSIGCSTLDVVAKHPDCFKVAGLAEGHDVELLARQVKMFKPRAVSVRDEESALRLKSLGVDCEVFWGIDGACEIARLEEVDLVVSAIVGAAGLVPTYAAVEAGKDIALANKETMVVAGHIVRQKAVEMGIKILPIDSEHSAIFQSLEGHDKLYLRRIILTASGGPFRDWSIDRLQCATLKDALRHPNWSMGAKITIDSATMMNKGLEVIEARWLFDIEPSKIDVVIHPQSIIHSLVEYIDGCVIAQLGVPDMRAPIAYALSYPARVESGVNRLELPLSSPLEFFEPDLEKFPLLKAAYEALESGGCAPVVLNAANEVAVEGFLKERIGFLDIPRIVLAILDKGIEGRTDTIDEILLIDWKAREEAALLVKSLY